MDFKHRNSRTTSLSELLDNSMFSKNIKSKDITNVIKHSTIFSFWNDIVGAKFANFTKPTALKSGKLFVSAKSPVIVQELSLYKPKLLNKINSYSRPLGIEVTDIIFSYKNYLASNPIKPVGIDDSLRNIDFEELNKVKVEDNIQKEIKEKIDRIKFLSDMQKDTLVSKIISNHKAKFIQNRDE